MAKKYDDDDGRVIADMSDVTRQPMILPRFDAGKKNRSNDHSEDVPETEYGYSSINAEERRAVIKGVVTASLLVGAIVAVAFAGLILLITGIWG